MTFFRRLFGLLGIACLVGITWPIFEVRAAEETACCLCHLKNESKKFCVKDVPKEQGAFRGCSTFLTDLKAGREMSTTYPQVDTVICEEGSLSQEQCKTLNVSGVCPSSPITFSNLPSKAGITGAQTIQSLDQQSATPTLGVPIPGLTFSSISREGGYIRIPFLAQYIAAAFRYAVGIVVICAIVMVVYGGFRYLVGSAAGGVKRGKTIIVDAIAGLIVTLGAVLMLQTINPATLNLDAIKIPFIPNVPLELEDSGDIAGDIDEGAYTAPNIFCPKSGGSSALSQILTSLNGKVTYRFGGKGGKPPYKEKESGAYYKYNNSCPSGTICLDCSGFINFVRSCAGLTKLSGDTTDIFQSAEVIETIDVHKRTVNGKLLQDGDLFGYTAKESKNGVGHVIMYFNGSTWQSRGGEKGRQSGGNPVRSAIPPDNKIYKHIVRVQP